MNNNMKEFINITKMSQKGLKKHLAKWANMLDDYTVIKGDGYLYLSPNTNITPLLLCAHMDTVHAKCVQKAFVEKHDKKTIISSPQGIGGDDRCGIYIIKKIVESGYKPFVVFTEDEEIGCVGAELFCRSKHITELTEHCKFIVELDRKGSNDAVYYDLDNLEFEHFVTDTTGYKTAFGSVSDISYIAPEVGKAAVNLSCGYYNPHTLSEYVVFEEMLATQYAVELLCNASLEDDVKDYEYIEEKYSFIKNYNYDSYFNYNSYHILVEGNLVDTYNWVASEAEAVGKFLMKYPSLSYKDIEVKRSLKW